MFEIAKNKLNFDFWKVCEVEEFVLFTKGRQIAEMVYQKYNINMWNMWGMCYQKL